MERMETMEECMEASAILLFFRRVVVVESLGFEFWVLVTLLFGGSRVHRQGISSILSILQETFTGIM